VKVWFVYTRTNPRELPEKIILADYWESMAEKCPNLLKIAK
jgi:hypothetical protein